MKKRVRYVRHGATHLVTAGGYQYPHTPLSELGVRQARAVAKRLKDDPPEIILSSPLRRALQTAEEIANETGKPIIIEECFREVCRPSKFWGKLYSDPEIKDEIRFIHENFENPDVRHSNEENFWDLRSRAVQAVACIAARPEKEIVVTTHGYFKRMLLAVKAFGPDVGYPTFAALHRFMDPQNTGIVTCAYVTRWDRSDGWIMLDDHAHLKGI